MRKLAQAVALSTIFCSTVATTTPVLAASSAALDGVDDSTILDSAASAYGSYGSAQGQSQAGIGFRDGNLYLYGPPNFQFGTHPLFSETKWDLLPSGAANSSGNVTNSSDIKVNSVGVGDFRSYDHRGWSLSVSVSDFKDVNDQHRIQPIREMLFKHATLMRGNFNVPVSQAAIDNGWFDFSPASGVSGLSQDAPNNILGSNQEVSVYPPSSPAYTSSKGEPIWFAKSGDTTKPNDPVQGKNIWGLSFLKRGDVQLIPINREEQKVGHFSAKLTWTLTAAKIV